MVQDVVPAVTAGQDRGRVGVVDTVGLGDRPALGLDLRELLRQLVREARGLLPGVIEVSVSTVRGDVPRTVVFDGDLAAVLDERQYADGEGPCLDAARTGVLVRVDDTAVGSADSARYDDFCRSARRHDVASCLAVPLRSGVDGLAGALNVYGRRAFDAQQEQLATAFAGHVDGLVLSVARCNQLEETVRQLEHALESRAVIEQAKGMLMADLGCDPDGAFQELRRRSRHSNRKLRDVALDVVGRATG